jgi:SAM-dependent methyltransferase
MSDCPVCKDIISKEYLGLYKGKSELFNRNIILQCIKCKLVFMNPMPNDVELKEYYKNVFLSDDEVQSSGEHMELVYKIQADERVNYLKRNGVLDGVKRVLDVGAGQGFLSDCLKENGYSDIDYYASEISEENIRTLLDKDITIFETTSNQLKFDLITFCFVLEHVINPVKFLKAFVNRLSPNGFIFIDVPNRDDTFKHIHEAHTLFFNKQSLTRLALEMDMDVVSLESYGVDRKALIERMNNRSLVRRLIPFWIRRKIYSFLKQEINLYEQYKFNSVGEDKQWIRCILKKKVIVE